jgi:hypothetical protein
MEKFWNFLFYATWIMLRYFSNNLIKKPIYSLIIRLFPKKKKKSFKEYQNYIKRENEMEQNARYSGNVVYAFNFMLMTTGFAFSTFFIRLISLIQPQQKYAFYFGLCTGVVGSIFINYFYLYSNGKYLNYFKLFNERTKIKSAYFTAILFHLIPIVILMTVMLKK